MRGAGDKFAGNNMVGSGFADDKIVGNDFAENGFVGDKFAVNNISKETSDGNFVKNGGAFQQADGIDIKGEALHEILAVQKGLALVRPTDNEVAQCLCFLLDGRSLSEIDKNELVKIIKALKFHTDATFRQISSLTHESYSFVYKVLK